jgi:putative PEP-CTERM system histidine kinase
MLPATMLTAAWALSSLVQLGEAQPYIERWLDAARYAAWFGFLLYVQHRRSPLTPLALAMGVLSVVLPLYAALVGSHLSFTLLAVLGLILTEQFFRGVLSDARWSAKPVCIGLAGTFLFDVLLFSEGAMLSAIDADKLTARGYVLALMVPFFWLSGMRQQDWVSRLQLSRQVAFQSLSLLLAGLYLLFMAGLGYYVRYFGSDWGRALQVGLLFVACVLLLAVGFSGTLRAQLRVWLGKNFLRYRYDYREEWLKFTKALASHANPDELSQHVIQGLAGMVESPAGALWLRDRSHQHYRQVARWNCPSVSLQEPVTGGLVDFMHRTGWVVNLSEQRSHPERYGALQLPGWMSAESGAWLVVPLPIGGELIGFVVLSSSRTKWDVNWEVTDLLKTAATQAASFLAQVQASEVLMESRKFESFNRMSAFVVHDLKNIVTQLSLMMKNAKRLKDNPEFQDDMIMTVENSLDRMRQLMLQLREGGAPAAGSARGVDLSAMATHWAAAARDRGRELNLHLEGQVLSRGHDERLLRVIGHVIQNALEATEQHGHQVNVRTFRLGSHACLEVQDNGVGMSEDFVKNRLFKPFQTTKQTGMGIGAYESAQYIQELGGKLIVESQEGSGTLIRLMLPLFDMGEPLAEPTGVSE